TKTRVHIFLNCPIVNKKSRQELIGPQGLRQDGRRANELRKIKCKPSVLSQADGSAYIEQGNTKCLAAVYGPREVDIWRLLEIASAVKQTFEPVIMTSLFARSQIDIYLQILQFDGGTIQICINAATLALIDAGIPMQEYVCACSAGCHENHVLLDLNNAEEMADTPELTVALLPKSGKFTLLQMDSRLHVDKLEPVMNLAALGCKDIYEILDETVREYVKDLLHKSSPY
ncbi:11379_t:CDS:2, partial [Cetraspora pellucida]